MDQRNEISYSSCNVYKCNLMIDKAERERERERKNESRFFSIKSLGFSKVSLAQTSSNVQ